ncbi:MAG: hypothetical protein E7363_00085 [Clostridiales bacterium]|nr:hypothetical protein [Clostridiales bacterium]
MLQVSEPTGSGFHPFVKTDRFLCAFATSAPTYPTERVSTVKRHVETDEVFVLLRGEANVLTVDDGGTQEECALKLGTAYTVTKNTWHALGLSVDALVVIVEGADTGTANTQTQILHKPYVWKRRLSEC